jgi:hypothetical protein
MKISLLPLFVSVIFCAVAQASEPQPKSVYLAPKFSYWQNAWVGASVPDQSALKGDWLEIGFASSKFCSILNHETANDDWYREDGIAAKSVHALLRFDSFKGGPGTDSKTAFGVKVLAVTADKPVEEAQGPFLVSSTEPQFALWGTPQTRRFYFSYACRISSADVSLLVCMQSLHLGQAPDVDGWVEEALACASHRHGAVRIFKRQL